jgi:hypothetical protein
VFVGETTQPTSDFYFFEQQSYNNQNFVYHSTFFGFCFRTSVFGDLADELFLFVVVSLFGSDDFCHTIGLERYIGHGGNVN